jgi:hypothetical protein
MHSASPRQLTVTARRAVVVFLVITLALCAWISSWTQVRGARHFHEAPSATPHKVNTSALELLELLTSVLAPPSTPIFVHAQVKQPAHFHNQPERHHHNFADSSVVSVDVSSPVEAARAELDASAAKAASALWQPSALPSPQLVVAADTPHTPWCEAPQWALKTSEPESLRRPPKPSPLA